MNTFRHCTHDLRMPYLIFINEYMQLILILLNMTFLLVGEMDQMAQINFKFNLGYVIIGLLIANFTCNLLFVLSAMLGTFGKAFISCNSSCLEWCLDAQGAKLIRR